jgi:hypothetical protein
MRADTSITLEISLLSSGARGDDSVKVSKADTVAFCPYPAHPDHGTEAWAVAQELE